MDGSYNSGVLPQGSDHAQAVSSRFQGVRSIGLRSILPFRKITNLTKTEKILLFLTALGLTMLVLGILTLAAHCQVANGNSNASLKHLNAALEHCADKLSGDPLTLATSLTSLGFGFMFASFVYYKMAAHPKDVKTVTYVEDAAPNNHHSSSEDN